MTPPARGRHVASLLRGSLPPASSGPRSANGTLRSSLVTQETCRAGCALGGGLLDGRHARGEDRRSRRSRNPEDVGCGAGGPERVWGVYEDQRPGRTVGLSLLHRDTPCEPRSSGVVEQLTRVASKTPRRRTEVLVQSWTGRLGRVRAVGEHGPVRVGSPLRRERSSRGFRRTPVTGTCRRSRHRHP